MTDAPQTTEETVAQRAARLGLDCDWVGLDDCGFRGTGQCCWRGKQRHAAQEALQC